MKSHLMCVLYGAQASTEPSFLKNWWEEVDTWATSLGLTLNEVSARFAQKPKGMVSGHGYQLSRYRRRIEREIESGNALSLELAALASEWKYKAIDWEFETMFGADKSAGMLCAAGINLNKPQGGSDASPWQFTTDAMRRCGDCISTRYGLAVIMPRNFMPGGYILGIAAEVPEDMMLDCNSWSRFAGKECDHIIRNVFGYNILNPCHLQIDVGGQGLGDWIEASSDRGRLEPQDAGLFVWTFQDGDDEEAFLHWDYPPVVAVREQLKEHKVFPWQQMQGID